MLLIVVVSAISTVLYVLIPFLVFLFRRIDARAIMVSGIAFYPFHLFLPMIVVFITGIPLILKSKGVYITLDGIGMENPDFSDALLVIDTMLFQIMLLQPFITLIYSRGVDLKIQDVRLILGTPLRRRILSSLFAFVIAGIALPEIVLLNFSGILHVDYLFFVHLIASSVFANLLVPSDSSKTSLVVFYLWVYIS